MAIFIGSNKKVKNIFINANGERKSVKSVWVNKDGVPTKVFKLNDSEKDIETAPTNAYSNWNYTLDEDNNVITLNYYTGTETDVIVYGKYQLDGKEYTTKICSNDEYTNEYTPYMFNAYGKYNGTNNCKLLKSITFKEGIDISDCPYMSYMFRGCLTLEQLDLSNLRCNNILNMKYMFDTVANIKSLNLSGFNTCNVIDMERMFYNCKNLTEIIVSKDKWLISATCKISYMWWNCGTSSVTYK